MIDFQNGVPFDPGYSPFSCSFIYNIEPIIEEISKYKAVNQKKFKMTTFEPVIYGLINRCSAFYLGCLLWGAFLSSKYKDDPKIIINNPVLAGDISGSSDFADETLNFGHEAIYMINFIKLWDKNYKHFLKKPFKVADQIIKILESYNEFVLLNNNFMDMRYTSDIKLSPSFDHFKELNQKQLDKLCDLIFDVINKKNIEELLKTGFYNPL